jgi:hypothetical protein
MQKHVFFSLSLLITLFLPNFSEAKSKVVLIAGKDSHGTNAHNWGEGVDLLSNALTKESGLNIETAIHKGGWPTDPSIFKNADTVVILSDGGGRHPINQIFKGSLMPWRKKESGWSAFIMQLKYPRELRAIC